MNIADCRALELLCRQRAKADPAKGWKWLGQAERWRKLGQRQSAQRNGQQQMHTGPMVMGPNTINGDLRGKQFG
jgi:hypothetical protein